MSKSVLKFLVLLCVGLIAGHFLTSIALYYVKFGFSVSAIQEYYRPDLFSQFAKPKGFEGLLKIALPHFFAMSLVFFVLGHFLLFMSRTTVRWSVVFATAAGLIAYNFLPFVIVYVSVHASYFVLPSFIAMTLGMCLMMSWVVRDVLGEYQVRVTSPKPARV